MNELDPLRGRHRVCANSRRRGFSSWSVVLGTSHAGDLSMPDIVPDIYQDMHARRTVLLPP